MKRHDHIRIAALCMAMSLLMCSCGETTEYADDNLLPTFTTTTAVQVIYDTLPNTIVTEPPRERETTTATSPIDIFIDDTDTEVCETEASESEETGFSLKLEDIPDVGLSEYYDKTYTRPTSATTEATFPEFTYPESQTEQYSDGYVSVSVTFSDTEVTTTVGSSAVTNTEQTTVSTADYDDEIHGEYSDSPYHELLRDDRVSKYTGRKTISHPYFYYTLSEKHQKIYDMMFTDLYEYESKTAFDISDRVTFDDIFAVYQLIYNYEYRLFNLSTTIEYLTDGTYISSVTYKYIYSKEDTKAMNEEILNRADKILSGISDHMNDYQIVKYLHDSIIVKCIYEENADQNTIYGSLVKNKALCQGYTRAMCYLCGEAGIKTVAVQGIANEEHMWNIVEMDGEYYHVDLTWDDPDRKKDYNSIRYDYFGLDDKRIQELRQVENTDYTPPAATGTKYHYYKYNGLVASSVEEAKKLFLSEVAKAAEKKSGTVQFMCSDDDVFAAVTELFFGKTEGNVRYMLETANDTLANKVVTDTVEYNSNKNTRTVKIYLTYK